MKITFAASNIGIVKLGPSDVVPKKFIFACGQLSSTTIVSPHITTVKMQLSEESKVRPVTCTKNITGSNACYRSALPKSSTSPASQSTSMASSLPMASLQHCIQGLTIIDSGYVPLILWLGYTRSVPRPSLIKYASTGTQIHS